MHWVALGRAEMDQKRKDDANDNNSSHNSSSFFHSSISAFCNRKNLPSTWHMVPRYTTWHASVQYECTSTKSHCRLAPGYASL